jgi:hypothetical protein|nr:hypothetical protein [Oxalobacteraceae bacterium]
MASITKVNGTTQPVFAIDVQNGSIANTANIAAQGPVQMAGPKLEFFSLTANSALSASGAANATGYINNILQAIQQTTTIAMYQVTPSNAAVLNIAVYPVGAANATQIVTAAQTANATGGLNIGIPTANVAASATFTNV